MSKESFSLEVQPRVVGKQSARKSRATAHVPGVVYGPKVKNMNVEVLEKSLKKFLSHHYDNTIFVFKSSESTLNNVSVLMKQKDIHPLTQKPTHIDFYALDLTKMIRVNVELKFVGRARGIADGGLFQPIAREVELECLPNKIPESIEVDVSELGVHESLHVSDIKLANDIKIITDPGVALCTVTIVKEEELTPVVAATPTEPEVIGKGKKEEGEAAPAPAAPAAGKKE